MNFGRLFKDLRFRLFYKLLLNPGISTVRRGEGCQWTFCEAEFGPTSVVLCAGAGHDISFEAALIKDYGCKIVLLDPSPTGIATVGKSGLPIEQLQFLPVGLAGKDGYLSFALPSDPSEGSFRVGQADSPTELQFPCRALSSLMKEFGWQHIDLLKIDIEGCEYAVIHEILETKLDVRQICVEFHHGPAFGHARNETVRTVIRLRCAGYQLIHRVHQDHTFLRRR